MSDFSDGSDGFFWRSRQVANPTFGERSSLDNSIWCVFQTHSFEGSKSGGYAPGYEFGMPLRASRAGRGGRGENFFCGVAEIAILAEICA